MTNSIAKRKQIEIPLSSYLMFPSTFLRTAYFLSAVAPFKGLE